MSEFKKFAEATFKAAQSPTMWLLSAERLRDGAEAILIHEQSSELIYLRAHEAATKKALAIACSGGQENGIAEIEARAPNYPAAQLLYAYALENLLKGIMIARDSSLVLGRKLNAKLKSHDLVKLANEADFELFSQEIPIAEALSKLSIWAGRYPVALFEDEYVKTPNADQLLDFGSGHAYVRALYEREHSALTSLLPKPITSRFGAVVVFRPVGT